MTTWQPSLQDRIDADLVRQLRGVGYTVHAGKSRTGAAPPHLLGLMRQWGRWVDLMTLSTGTEDSIAGRYPAELYPFPDPFDPPTPERAVRGSIEEVCRHVLLFWGDR